MTTWNRKDVKAKGKASFKENFWKCVLTALILAIIGGGIGGMEAAYRYFLNKYVPMAPSNVAIVPNTISQGAAPVRILEIRQPIVNPGTAEKVKKGRTVSASERRN